MHCTCPPDSVLIVTPWLEGGGAQKALSSLLSRHPDTHFHVVALFSGCTNYGQIETQSDVFTLMDNPRNLLGSLRASWSIGAALRHHKRVYSLLRGSHVVLGLRFFPRRKGQTMVGSIHQMPSSEGQSVGAIIEDFVLKRFTKRASFITSPSHRAVEEALVRGYSKNGKIFYESNIIVPYDQPLEPPRTGKLQSVRLLFAGRLTRQKGLDQIPELLKDVERPAILRILGDGPDKPELERRLRSVRGDVKVEFIPYTSNIVSHIDWCDAIFMPSRAELNPVFLHEAWSRGRPALVSDIGAFRDLQSEGVLMLASDSEDYASGIEQISQDTAVRNRAFQAAKATGTGTGLLDKFLASSL